MCPEPSGSDSADPRGRSPVPGARAVGAPARAPAGCAHTAGGRGGAGDAARTAADGCPHQHAAARAGCAGGPPPALPACADALGALGGAWPRASTARWPQPPTRRGPPRRGHATHRLDAAPHATPPPGAGERGLSPPSCAPHASRPVPARLRAAVRETPGWPRGRAREPSRRSGGAGRSAARRRSAASRGRQRAHRRPQTLHTPPPPSPGSPCPGAPVPFFPPASTPGGMVAQGTKTRWARQRCPRAGREGTPSSTTSRTARASTRWGAGRPEGARAARAA